LYSIGPVIVLAAAGEARPGLEHWPVYIAALGAQFAADYFIQAPYQRFVNDVPFSLAARFLSSAFVVDVALAPIGLLVAFVAVDHPVALTFVLPLIGLLVIFARERQVRIDHALELSHAYRGTALLLGDVVEADDAYTGSHSRDVVTLVLEVSDRLQLNARDRRDAEFAALLHDIGKIRVPAEIINKPGKLDDHEWAVMKQHTIEGERIVRVCDAFSAMTTDRAYRKARSAQEALTELRRCTGTDFDPAVVEALAEAVAAGI